MHALIFDPLGFCHYYKLFVHASETETDEQAKQNWNL
jgi:hypothetical protein